MPVQNNEPKINFTSNPEEILKYDKPTIANTEIEMMLHLFKLKI